MLTYFRREHITRYYIVLELTFQLDKAQQKKNKQL